MPTVGAPSKLGEPSQKGVDLLFWCGPGRYQANHEMTAIRLSPNVEREEWLQRRNDGIGQYWKYLIRSRLRVESLTARHDPGGELCRHGIGVLCIFEEEILDAK